MADHGGWFVRVAWRPVRGARYAETLLHSVEFRGFRAHDGCGANAEASGGTGVPSWTECCACSQGYVRATLPSMALAGFCITLQCNVSYSK